MILRPRNIEYMNQLINKSIIVCLALICVIGSNNLNAQTSKQELWNNIDLVHPDVKVLSKKSKKKREAPFIKGGSKVLIPIGGAVLVGTGIYYLANKNDNECPDTKANDDLLSLDCGGSNSIDLFANDGGDDLVLESVDLSNLPMNMEAVIGEGVVSLTGSSESSFQIPYTIKDECGSTDSAIIEVVFESLPDIQAVPDDAQAFGDQQTTLFALNNDIGLNLSLESVSAQSGASTSISNNTIIYTPLETELESDILNYQIIDDCGQISNSTVNISFIDDSSILAVDDVLEANCNSTVSFNVLNNDQGDNLSLTLVSGAPNGVNLNFDEAGFITINGIGTESFTFEYFVESDNGNSSSSTVFINVVTSDVSAIDDEYFTEGNQTLIFDPTGNDQGSDLVVSDLVQPVVGGQVLIPQNGNELSFSPTPGFSGIVEFSYTISDNCDQSAQANVQITVGDLPDVLANDDSYISDCNQSLTMNVVDNDIGDDFNVVSIQNDSGVALVINSDNSITASNVGGQSFSFQYTIANSNNVSDIGNVNVEVISSNLQTVTDSLFTGETTPVSVNPLLNDLGTNLSITNFTEPTNGGILEVNGTLFTYTPPVGFTGATMFAYTVEDDCGNVAEGLVVILVQPDSTNLIANNDSFLLPCNPDADLDLLANDQGQDIAISNISTVPGVTLLLQSDGTVHIEGNNVSSFSFQYTISDADGNSAVANVNVTINQVPIQVTNDSYSTNYETALELPILDNDSGDGLTILGFTQATGGALTLNPDNTFTFLPDDGFSGNTSFNYTVVDNCGQSSEASVNILVLESPDAVTASDDSFQLSCNPNNILDVLQNDTGAGLTIVSITNPSAANVQIDPNGLQIQVSGNNLNTFSFEYTIQGSGGFTDNATVVVSVSLPQISAIDETYSSDPNSSVSVDVLQNDLGQGIDIFSYDTNSNGGTLDQQDDGTFLFTPNPGFSGSTSFQYTIVDECGQTDTAQLTFIVDSLPEIQAIDDNILADCNSFISFNLLSNDLGENLSITSIQNSSGATVTDTGNGNISISNVGSENFQFTYDIENNFGQTASATVFVEIVFPDLFISDDNYATDFQSGIVIDPLLNDQGNNITISSFTQSNNGQVIDLGNGILNFIPDAGFSGTANFTYTIQDACGQQSTANITVQVAECPIDATDNNYSTQSNQSLIMDVTNDDTGSGLTITSFSQPNNGTISDIGNNLLEFVPEDGFSGTVTFTYTIENECGITQSATVTIVIEDCSLSAQDDLYTAGSGSTIIISSLANDSGSNITLIGSGGSPQGTVTPNPDGTITYTAPIPFCTSDSFSYDISNDCGQTTSAVVTIDPITNPIILMDDSYSTNSGQLLLISPLDNDSGDNIFISTVTTIVGGTVNILVDGQLQFIPEPGFSGIASFAYTAEDQCGHSASANVEITIADCAIMAMEDVVSTEGGAIVTIEPLLNDQGNSLQISSFGLPSSGSLISNSDGTFTYTADSPFCEETSFTYVIINDCNETASSTVTINPITATLFAADDTASTIENTSVDIDILANDTFSGMVSFMIAPSMDGNFIINSDNTLNFTPNNGFIGTTIVEYTLVDECNQTTTAQISISVGPDNCDIEQLDDQFSVFVGESITFEPLQNDIGAGLFIVSFNQPTSGGTVTDLGNNVLSFASDGSFTGNVQFDYVIENECGDQAMGVVVIEILECSIEVAFSISNANCGFDDGEIQINNITPMSNYDINWSNGAMGLSNSNLSAGNYILTVTDLNNPACVFTEEITVPEDDLVFLQQIGGTAPTCQSDGSLNIQTTSLGSGPIVIEILLNGNLIDIEQVNAGDPLDYDISAGGTYTLFTYDQSIGAGCAEAVDITLDLVTDVLVLDNTDTTLPSGAMASDGEVTYAVQNSNANSWTFDLNGSVFTSTSPSYTFTGLAAGNYTLMVTDDNGCTGSTDFALTSVTPLMASNDSGWEAAQIISHPQQRLLEQRIVLQPLLDALEYPVEHPLVSSDDLDNAQWSFEEQFHIHIGLRQNLSDRSVLNFRMTNTQILAYLKHDSNSYLPTNISMAQWSGGYLQYFDRNKIFYGELGVAHQFVAIDSSLGNNKTSFSQTNPYLKLGAQISLNESFGLESNLRWNQLQFNHLASDPLPTLQVGLYRKF